MLAELHLAQSVIARIIVFLFRFLNFIEITKTNILSIFLSIDRVKMTFSKAS